MNNTAYQQKELLRNAILLQLEAAVPAALPTSTLQQGIKLAGHPLPPKHLEKQLAYLEGKSLINSEPHTLSPGSLRFKLTSKGQDYLEKQGLA